MKLPRLSTFPLDKPFELQDAATPFSEMAARLVVNIFSDSPEIVGTATVIAGNTLVTAKHIIDDILPKSFNNGTGN